MRMLCCPALAAVFADSISANDAAAAQENAKTEPDLSFLETLHPAITMIHLMATSVNTVLIPLAASHTTVRREMEKRRTSAMNRMEDKINGILQRTIDVVISWVTRLLAGQKKTDFRPKEDHTGSGSSWVNLLQTPVSSLPPLLFSTLLIKSFQDLPQHLQIPHQST